MYKQASTMYSSKIYLNKQSVQNFDINQFIDDITDEILKNNKNEIQQKVLYSNNPFVWGPKLWYIIHNSSIFYPSKPSKEDQQKMLSFIKSLSILLPCTKCKLHYNEYISKNIKMAEKAVESKEALQQFFIDLHNHTNKLTNKPVYEKKMI